MKNMKTVLTTQRTILREMSLDDFKEIALILQDEETMTAYEHAFSDEEVKEWIIRQMKRYEAYGFGLWAMIEKESGKLIGQCGLTMQETPYGDKLEIGYLLNRAYWHKGFAAECAAACKEYAFQVLKAEEVTSIIRDNNLASQKVALRNGMEPTKTFVKHYHGIDMPHIIFSIKSQK